jgi:muramoyltetrapeptide carboxypeptidase
VSASLSVGPGDPVALVSPGSSTTARGVAFARRLVESWGLRVHSASTPSPRHGYLAATDAERLAEFQQAWSDPDVRAVLCLRGGYGCQRIVDDVDWAAGRKLLVGFSDVTALQLGLYTVLGLPSLHGPCVGAEPPVSPYAAESLRLAMTSFGTASRVAVRADEPTAALCRGRGTATGVLLGGNLAVLATSLVDTGPLRGAILVLEDVDEPPYRVDRYLTMLGRRGVLGALAAVALGRFTGRAQTVEDAALVLDVLHDRLTRYGVDFMGGLPVGHGPDAVAVPLGQQATLDFDAGQLRLAGGVG